MSLGHWSRSLGTATVCRVPVSVPFAGIGIVKDDKLELKGAGSETVCILDYSQYQASDIGKVVDVMSVHGAYPAVRCGPRCVAVHASRPAMPC